VTLESTTTPTTGSRLGFGGVAVQYDRARPGYPEQLIDAILEYGLLGRGDPALDVGAGTGQATLQLAGRGLQMPALEPSAEMVAVANDRFAAAGADAHAIVGPFEQAELDPCSYSLICAATSWHWIDPAVRFQIAAGALAPGGVLAVLWTWPRWRATALRDELDQVYFRSGAPLAEMGPLLPAEPDPGALAAEWVRETEAAGAFDDPRGSLCEWAVRYSAAGYAELLSTYNDHATLPSDVRAGLLRGVEHVIDGAGGTIELPYRTLLLLTRAR
jgi:SAM-dependent methyltransferase